MAKNKFYWFEGVTEKGVRSLLANENSSFSWLRSQKNRRLLVVIMAIGISLIGMGSYWPSLKALLNVSSDTGFIIFLIIAILVIIAVVGGYSLLRISVRGIADAPNELLDERQIEVRNDSYRYAYYIMGYLALFLLLLMRIGPELKLFQMQGNDGSYLMIAALFAYSSLPSMVLAWRERDIEHERSA